MTTFSNFLVDKFLGDRSAIRLSESTLQFAVKVMEKEGVSFLGKCVGLEPIQKELKSLDAAIYVNNFFKSLEPSIRSFCSLAYDICDLTTYLIGFNDGATSTVTSLKTNLVSLLYGVNKSIGDGAAACKFLGRFVPLLASHKQTFGIVKNVCSVTRAVWDIAAEAYTLRDIWRNPTPLNDADAVKKENAQFFRSWVLISASTFSALLNGFGALDTIFGSNMPAAHRMPTAIWIFWSAMGTLSGVAGECLKQSAR